MNSFLSALKAYWLLVLILVALGVVAGGYFAGYRLDGAGIAKVGTLTLTGLPEKTAIYIDAARRVRAAGGEAVIPLTPGTHSVIVDSAGNDPWNEIVSITSAADTRIAPLLVSASIAKTSIVGADAQKAMALARATTLPTKAKPLTLVNGCALIYASGGRVIAEATTSPSCAAVPPYLSCAPASSENPSGTCAPTLIFTPSAALSAVIPFPGREDALIVWAGKLVYVVEIDPREPQFFAPIFRGAVTGIAPWSASSIAVTDGTQVVELPL